MDRFEMLAPAKINLMLKVTGRREDGYHDLQSLMVPLTVGDTLSVGARSPRPGGETPPLHITCDNSEIPTGDDSLLGKAFRFAAEILGYPGGLEIELAKEIPVGAGLGGGSSDAAAVIRVVEQITDRKLSEERYPELAYQVGADVPFFHAVGAPHRGCPSEGRARGPAPTDHGLAFWIAGIGESVKPCDIGCPLHFLLVNPGISISTKWVYENLGGGLTSQNPAATVPPSFESLEALLPYVTNDLESVVLTHYPVIAELKTHMQALGADAALMSGSGSTVFGLFSQKEKRDGALEKVKAEYPNYWVADAEIL